MDTKNIVLFGETGVGKSSIVNLMAGEQRALTSSGMERCTMHWNKHAIRFGGHNYNVFDTIGLEEPELGMEEYLKTILNARNLVMELENKGGIDLLLFCVRAGRVTATIQNNYRLFHEWLCEKKVPIVLVLTGLERETVMEDWWTRNKSNFDKHRIVVDGHACITAANDLDGRHRVLYEESRKLVHSLVKKHTYDRSEGGWKAGYGWLKRFVRSLKELLLGDSMEKKDIVTVLTTRCGVPREAAQTLATYVRDDSRQ